jgi:hypothetical protein
LLKFHFPVSPLTQPKKLFLAALTDRQRNPNHFIILNHHFFLGQILKFYNEEAFAQVVPSF